jgi:PhnB protein
MGSDAPPDQFDEPTGFSVALEIEDPAEAERLFTALEQGGKVKMPLAQTFWAAKFGMLVDRFGIPWIINCTAAAAGAA